jgi:hypothetical protein
MMDRTKANRLVRDFEAVVQDEAHSGAGHPDLFDWHRERLKVARERLIRHMAGQDTKGLRMPRQPEVEY